MKKVVASLFLLFSFVMIYAAEPDSTLTSCTFNPINSDNCTFKGIPLYGKVKVVDSCEDFKVQIVTAFPDLAVQVVTAFPDKCGRWEFVDCCEDFTVKFVDSAADFTIEYVTIDPGVR